MYTFMQAYWHTYACLAVYIHIYMQKTYEYTQYIMHVYIQTHAYLYTYTYINICMSAFKHIYFQNLIFLELPDFWNYRNLKFWNFYISITADILEIRKDRVQEMHKSENCEALYNSPLVNTFTLPKSEQVTRTYFCAILAKQPPVGIICLAQMCGGLHI